MFMADEYHRLRLNGRTGTEAFIAAKKHEALLYANLDLPELPPPERL